MKEKNVVLNNYKSLHFVLDNIPTSVDCLHLEHHYCKPLLEIDESLLYQFFLARQVQIVI